MKKQPDHIDRNFDDLAHRFRRNVYGGLKGDIRLAVLERDLRASIPALYLSTEPAKSILDAGGGQGQFSLGLAALSHKLDMCDISAEMLAMAKEEYRAAAMSQPVNFFHQSIQSLAEQARIDKNEGYDLVLCHAVLEWVADPEQILRDLLRLTKPGGYLSLTFFNVNSIAFKNLLRGNFDKVVKQDFKGYRGSLTPTNPLDPVRVMQWLSALPVAILAHSGIRCFHDYLLDPALRGQQADVQIALELELSTQEPFRSLARYIHLVMQKQA